MRRVAAAIVATLVALAPLTPARAGTDAPVALEATARASVLFQVVDVQPQFDPAIVDSRSSSSNIGSTSIDSAIWPSFLVDAFFFLYSFQSVERVALGIAEARHPQGPQEADATQSNLLFTNTGGGESVPGRAGRAHAIAKEGEASGDAAGAQIVLPVGTIGKATASSGVTTRDGVATAHAEQTLHDVAIGPLKIRTIAGTARTKAGGGAPEASQRLAIVGASVNGEEVEVTGDGVRAQTASAQQQVNAALKAAGIQASIAPAVASTESAPGASSGGLLIEARQKATDPTGTPREVQLLFLLGSARASSSAVQLGHAGSNGGDGGTFVDLPSITIPGSPGVGGGAPLVDPDGLRKTIRRTVVITVAAPVRRVGARGAYLAVMLIAFGLLLIRPFLRVISRAT